MYTSPVQLRTGTQQGSVAAALPASQGRALLNILVIPLGIAGLGGVWQALRTTVATPGWPAEVLFGLSTAMWISLSAAYVVMRLRGSGSFTADRLHPVYGPYTALGTQDAEQDPGDEGAGDTEQAS